MQQVQYFPYYRRAGQPTAGIGTPVQADLVSSVLSVWYYSVDRQKHVHVGSEAAMIDALQQVVSQFESFSPEEQAELAKAVQHVIDEKVGYTTIYGPHTDEEFETLLDALDAAASHEEYEAIWEKQPKRRVKREELTHADAWRRASI